MLVGDRHRRAGPRTQKCEPDCSACAEQLRTRFVHAIASIVLNMYLDAVRVGEWTVEHALRQALGPVSKLGKTERLVAHYKFMLKVLNLPAQRKKTRKRNAGMPTGWIECNRVVVDQIAEHEKLPRNNVRDAISYDRPSAFIRAADWWAECGIKVSPEKVERAYYPPKVHKT